MNNTKKWIICLLMMVIGYYFLFPSRNWLGKSYLETTENDGFAVVELFTSESCSSCPAADELMAKIRNESPGKKIYLMAFHVDYWNHLNWEDRFSSLESSEHQKQYSSWMGTKMIYTPQFVINGTSEFAGDDQRTLYSIVATELQKKPKNAIALEVKQQQDMITVTVKTAIKDEKNQSVFIALIKKDAVTQVKAGENRGRKLNHVQIVEQTALLSPVKNEAVAHFSKPENFNSKQWEFLGYIQNQKTGVISAATRAEF